MLKTLRNRDFLLLWSGGVISLAGDWVLNIGLPIYVFLLTHSVLATGLMLLADGLPGFLLGSVAGVFADRWDRRRTMIVSDALLALALLPLLLVHSVDRVWIVYAVAVAQSILQQFFVPAQGALLPNLVGEEQLVPANSLNSIASNVARLAGPAIGGVVAAVWGLPGFVLLDAASFALSGLLIALIVVPKRAPVPPAVPVAEEEVRALRRLVREWAGGLRLIARDRTLSVLLIAFAITALGEGVMGALYAVFVYVALHGVALQIGELMSAQAIGGLLGGLLVGLVGKRMLSRWAIGLCSVAFGALDLVIFNAPAVLPPFLPAGVTIFAVEIGLFIAVGIPGSGMLSGAQSLLQIKASDEYRGRVMGALQAVMSLMLLTGATLASVFGAQVGVVRMLNIQGGGYVLAGVLLILLLPRTRELRAPLPEVADAGLGETMAAEV